LFATEIYPFAEYSVALQLKSKKTGDWHTVSLFTDLEIAKNTCRFCSYKSVRLVDCNTGIEFCHLTESEEYPDLQWLVPFAKWD